MKDDQVSCGLGQPAKIGSKKQRQDETCPQTKRYGHDCLRGVLFEQPFANRSKNCVGPPGTNCQENSKQVQVNFLTGRDQKRTPKDSQSSGNCPTAVGTLTPHQEAYWPCQDGCAADPNDGANCHPCARHPGKEKHLVGCHTQRA